MGRCSTLTSDDVRRRQSLPLDVKVNLTVARIEEWIRHYDGMVYTSFSGGKDSTVLADIVKKVDKSIPSVFCDTGVEYPEVRKFGIAHADEVIRPRKSFKQVIEDYGYPVVSKEVSSYVREARHSTDTMREKRLGTGSFSIPAKWRFLVDAPFESSERCCDVMKKRPFKMYERKSGRKPMVGTMASDSSLRMSRYIRFGCNSFSEARPLSAPMSFWTEQDVLAYIDRNGIEIAETYGDVVCENGVYRTTGLPTTGCMYCMFGIQFENQRERGSSILRRSTRSCTSGVWMNLVSGTSSDTSTSMSTKADRR